MSQSTSPFLIIFREPPVDPAHPPTSEQKAQILDQWQAWYDDLAAKGKLQLGHPLKKTGRVLTKADGRIVDGPFVESKEAIGGFFLVYVSGEEEATKIARRCPGLEIGMTVEVRPVAGMCPALRPEDTAVAEMASV